MLVKIPRKFELEECQLVRDLTDFVQSMVNRLVVGKFRYGDPYVPRQHMRRLRKELAAFERTGNREHLRNMANYCFLEYIESTHDDANVDSVTRGRI